MKRVLFILAALSLSYFAQSQTVEGIQVKSVDEKIVINYRIGGSTIYHMYNITLTCSIDGGPRFEPKSVIGDVGRNIAGGKSYYTIEWDVFQDLDEVGNAEFFIKVDMISDNTPMVTLPSNEPDREQVRDNSAVNQSVKEQGPQKETFDRAAFVAYNGSILSPYGISVGGIRNWGFYASLRLGYYADSWETDLWLTPVGGLTKYIYSNGKYRLHGYAGLGATYEAYEEYIYDTNWTDSYFTVDAGFINVYGMLSLSIGLEFIRDYGTEFVFGIGFVF